MSDSLSVTYTKLFVPTLEILREKGGETAVHVITQELLKRGFADGGKRKGSMRSELEYQAAWARSYLKIYGALENPTRGMWKIGPNASAVRAQSIPQIVSEVVAISSKNSIQKKKMTSKTKASIRSSSTKSNTSATPARSSSDVAVIDQAKMILSLLGKGFMTNAAATQALQKLGETAQ